MNIIEPIYLPFSRIQLEKHFAPGHSENAKKYLNYYLNSVKRFKEHVRVKDGVTISDSKLPRQLEKDERFWVVTCLLNYYYSDNRNDLFSNLLSATFGEKPPIEDLSSWGECLQGDNLQLYFEVALPSPESYKVWLAKSLPSRHFIPYVLDAARHKSGMKNRLDLEGATHVDALLINPDKRFAILFEAKVLSDISCHITYDVMRNQLIRNIDVMLEDNKEMPVPLSSRLPAHTLFVLLTPQMFRDNPSSRYYGLLYNEYKKDPQAIKRDLPHRADQDLSQIGRRIGWLTWEQCEAQFPSSCPWLKIKPYRVQFREEKS